MSTSILVNLVIQAIGGIIGGSGIGPVLKDASLGPVGNSIIGAIGGGVGGQVLQALIPALAGAAGSGVDRSSLVGGAIAGGVSGGAVTAIVGIIKNKMS